jgi:DtxR family transcriptional regulator, Mn-dependent transcriptional regulator
MPKPNQHAGEANRLDPKAGAARSRSLVEGWGWAATASDALHLMAMAGPALTDSIQDYLKAIYKLQEGDARVSITALAREQGIAAGSASEMVKKLAALDLVDHAPYKGVQLTAAGERVAVEVIRHHRLLELYLAETLGLDVEDVHDEADRLEHVLSEELEARIDRALGFPTHDPHGDPIPNAALEWPKSQTG